MLRKLALQRKSQEDRIQKKPRKRDIIAEYADFKSNAYAPKTRLGLLVDQRSNNFDSRGADIQSISAQDLAETVPSSMLNSTIFAPKSLKEPQKRSERIIDGRLEHVQSLIEAKRASNGQTSKSNMSDGRGDTAPTWMKKRSKIHRPETPKIKPEPDNTVSNAIVLLQRLLRGRAVQNMMFEGRTRRRELLRELRYEERLEEAAHERT